MSEIGIRIKKARMAIDMHQDVAAEKMELSRPVLSSIEACKREPTAEEVVRFADLYHVDVRSLLYDDFKESPMSDEEIRHYLPFYKVFCKLSDRDQEDIMWAMEQRVNEGL